MTPEGRSILDEEVLPPGGELSDDNTGSLIDPQGEIGSLDESPTGGAFAPGEHEHLRPFDYMRHWGFHHSSTEGRFMEKNVPLNFSSWLNRPFHLDWFAGPLLSDSPNKNNNVKQTNALFGGLRFGWDFDYYWGTEWRFGWSDPEIFYEGSSLRQPGQYWVSDVNLIYYPWGDTRVRPFFIAGMGISQVGSIHNDGGPLEANLLGTPFGLGIQFQQTPWLAWRAEIMDNLAWGSEGISTTQNISFTAGMNIRYGDSQAFLLAVANVAALLVELPVRPPAPPTTPRCMILRLPPPCGEGWGGGRSRAHGVTHPSLTLPIKGRGPEVLDSLLSPAATPLPTSPDPPPNTRPPRIAVVGGGITGLAAAHRLRKLLPQVELQLFEASERLGGPLFTIAHDESLLEQGADSFLIKTPFAPRSLPRTRSGRRVDSDERTAPPRADRPRRPPCGGARRLRVDEAAESRRRC